MVGFYDQKITFLKTYDFRDVCRQKVDIQSIKIPTLWLVYFPKIMHTTQNTRYFIWDFVQQQSDAAVEKMHSLKNKFHILSKAREIDSIFFLQYQML